MVGEGREKYRKEGCMKGEDEGKEWCMRVEGRVKDKVRGGGKSRVGKGRVVY